jgi:hypothetical protein
MVGEGVPAFALQSAGDGQVFCAEFQAGVLWPLQGMHQYTEGTQGVRRGKVGDLFSNGNDLGILRGQHLL